MRVLNLYAGIGGNRKLWGDTHEITAVEYNQEIANIYKDHFPNDTVIVADAHEYLLKHYSEFDFIWSSPPCPSHSRANNWLNAQGVIRYPDMSLYQQILLLKHFHKGRYVVENVVPYYDPLIKDYVKIDRHLFWTNFNVGLMKFNRNNENLLNAFSDKRIEGQEYLNKLQKIRNTDLSKYSISTEKKCLMLRNMVIPEIGLHFLNRALDIKSQEQTEQKTLF